MQSFWAIIHFAFFLSDWFIAHSNVLKGLNTPYEQVWLQSNLENPGLWGLCYSAWDCRDAVCQLLHIPTTRTAETGLQVPKDPYRTGGWTSSPVQSCRMSIFSHPVQISQYGTILHLRCDSRQQITRIMVNGKKKTTNKQNRERCQVLTSVYFLSYHSLKLLPNAIK